MSFIQNRPRLSGINHGTGSSATSPSYQYTTPPTGQQTHFYASSEPSSAVGLHQQSLQIRPPVPLFSNSTGSIPQANMAPPVDFAGRTFSELAEDPCPNLTKPSDSMYDFTAVDGDVFDDDIDFATELDALRKETGASEYQTVSPQDLMVEDISAPPSGAYTNLTTPDTQTLSSPYITNSNDVSPDYNNLPLDNGAEKWDSLFPENNQEPINNAPVPQPIGTPTVHHVAPKMSRNNSSPGKSNTRSSNQGRHSFTSGIGAKRRDKPLPAITVDDPHDTVAMKRARNTMAARKSREKRQANVDALERRVEELEGEVEHWKGVALGQGLAE